MYEPNPDDVIKQLGRLTERQRQVLRLVCNRKSYKQVAEELGIGVNGVKSHMQHIYMGLNLKTLGEDERKRVLQEVYCRGLGGQLPTAPLENRDLVVYVPKEVAEMVDRDDPGGQEIANWQAKPIIVQPPPARTKPLVVTVAWLLSLCLVLLIGVGGTYYFTGGFKSAPTPAQPQFIVITTTAGPATATVAATATRSNSATPLLAPTAILPSATATTVPPTASPLPTNTPIPSSTPIPYLFQDNFDVPSNGPAGLGPGWNLVSGDPQLVQKELSATSNTWLTTGDSTWRNYRVEFSLDENTCDRNVPSPFVLGVRVQDISNMAAFVFGPCGERWAWYTVKQSKWAKVPNSDFSDWPRSDTPGILYQVDHVTVMVQGPQLSITVENQNSVFVYTAADKGGVAFYLSDKVLVDDLKVVALP